MPCLGGQSKSNGGVRRYELDLNAATLQARRHRRAQALVSLPKCERTVESAEPYIPGRQGGRLFQRGLELVRVDGTRILWSIDAQSCWWCEGVA